jgi:hypothetical protein
LILHESFMAFLQLLPRSPRITSLNDRVAVQRMRRHLLRKDQFKTACCSTTAFSPFYRRKQQTYSTKSALSEGNQVRPRYPPAERHPSLRPNVLPPSVVAVARTPRNVILGAGIRANLRAADVTPCLAFPTATHAYAPCCRRSKVWECTGEGRCCHLGHEEQEQNRRFFASDWIICHSYLLFCIYPTAFSPPPQR